MKHMTEEELIAYREGVAAERMVIAQHLAACEECRAELERIETVLAALDTLLVPNPGDDDGRRVWQQIAPRLPERPAQWWQAWFEPKRLAAVGIMATLLVAAFIAGRSMRDPIRVDVATKEQIRERVLVVAVGEHLGRSEMMLVELSNAEPLGPAQKRVDISAEQHRAEDLLEENRLYRQTALKEGDANLASVLDDLVVGQVLRALEPRRHNWKRFARKSRRAEFCSKFEWSAGSSRNGRRPQSPLRRRKTLRKAKGTRHDPAECSV